MIYVVKDIFYLIFSGFLTWFILKVSINFLKKHLVDFPNNRSSHKSPKPTAGGISFLFSISIISFFKGIYVPLFAIPLAFIGFIDDKWGVKPWIRLTAQIITVIVYFYVFYIYGRIFSIFFFMFFSRFYVVIDFAVLGAPC